MKRMQVSELRSQGRKFFENRIYSRCYRIERADIDVTQPGYVEVCLFVATVFYVRFDLSQIHAKDQRYPRGHTSRIAHFGGIVGNEKTCCRNSVVEKRFAILTVADISLGDIPAIRLVSVYTPESVVLNIRQPPHATQITVQMLLQALYRNIYTFRVLFYVKHGVIVMLVCFGSKFAFTRFISRAICPRMPTEYGNSGVGNI